MTHIGPADFRSALDHHIGAITSRDLAAYSATIHDDMTLVLPLGRRMHGRAAVEEFHREFFGSTTWTQEMTLLNAVVSDGVGSALYEASYRDVDDLGQPIGKRFLVGLVFVRTGTRWLLIHDQCTPLPD